MKNRETIDVLEPILFTRISIKMLEDMPFSEVAKFMNLISYDHKLDFFIEEGNCYFTPQGYKKASDILKRSILLN